MTRKQLAIIDALGWPAATWVWMYLEVGARGPLEGMVTLGLGLWAIRKLSWALDDDCRDPGSRIFAVGVIGFIFGKAAVYGPYEFTTWLFARMGIMLAIIVVPISLVTWVVRLLN